MTTISSTGTAPVATTSPAPAAKKPYDGTAAVAKAYAKADAAIAAQDNSALNKKLVDLPNTVINMLHGGAGNDLINTLLNSSTSNLINSKLTFSLTHTALAAAAYKRGQAAAAVNPVSNLIDRLIKANTSA